jgi:hypothetical protein
MDLVSLAPLRLRQGNLACRFLLLSCGLEKPDQNIAFGPGGTFAMAPSSPLT